MFDRSEASTAAAVGSTGLAEVIAGLLLVLLLIVSLAWLYKRFGAGTLGVGGMIKIRAAISLGNRDRIALIVVGGKHLLVGISPGRISTLHVFDQAPEFSDGPLPSPERTSSVEAAPDSAFAHKLHKALAGLRT